jgi:hypothetical protein
MLHEDWNMHCRNLILAEKLDLCRRIEEKSIKLGFDHPFKHFPDLGTASLWK